MPDNYKKDKTKVVGKGIKGHKVPDDYKKDKTKVVGKGIKGHKVPDDYKKDRTKVVGKGIKNDNASGCIFTWNDIMFTFRSTIY